MQTINRNKLSSNTAEAVLGYLVVILILKLWVQKHILIFGRIVFVILPGREVYLCKWHSFEHQLSGCRSFLRRPYEIFMDGCHGGSDALTLTTRHVSSRRRHPLRGLLLTHLQPCRSCLLAVRRSLAVCSLVNGGDGMRLSTLRCCRVHFAGSREHSLSHGVLARGSG
jgi:hypothetical protein